MRRRVLDVEFWEEMNGNGMFVYFYFLFNVALQWQECVCGPYNDTLSVKIFIWSSLSLSAKMTQTALVAPDLIAIFLLSISDW